MSLPPVSSPPPLADSGYPVLLNDVLKLDLTQVNGQSLPYSSQRLSNIYDCAIAIDEIRFFVQPNPLNVLTGVNPVNGKHIDFGQMLTAMIRVGQLNLMQTPIHLRTLGTRWQDAMTWNYQLEGQLGGLAFMQYSNTFYRWVLPCPLYLARNHSLDCMISIDKVAARLNDPQALFPGLNVHIGIVGRLVPNMQSQQVPYPFAMEYGGFIGDGSSSQYPTFLMGNNPQLLNPFYNPLNIERINTSLYVNSINVLYKALWYDVARDLGTNVAMRLWDSRGNNVAGLGGGDPITLNNLVDARTGDWEVQHQLDAGQWFNCEMYYKPNAITKMLARIGLIGTHMAQFVA